MMTSRVFYVLDEIRNNVEFDNAVKTAHWSCERIERHNKIVQYLGRGKCVGSFIVDTNHVDGYEIHNVYSNGVVLIQNEETKRVVTELIARPQQIRRYWEGVNKVAPQRLVELAMMHQEKGWNNW